jgi:hypothetical protein
VTAHPATGTAVFELSTVYGKDASALSEGMERAVQGGDTRGLLDEETTRIPAAPKTDAGVRNGEAGAEGEISGDKRARIPASKPDVEDEKARTNKPKDPMRMFGILIPQALRLAQAGAIKMVEDLVPKLASVDAEMKEVEIKIRRARKHRAKAEALEKTDEPTVEGSRKEGVVS